MGLIASAYGVRGWVKVRPYTEQPEALLGYATWWLRRRSGGAWQPVDRLEGRAHADALVAQLAGVATREDAAALAGALVGVPREQLPQLGAGYVYHADLVGLDVVNRSGERIGRVVAVEDFGAHPVLRVEGEEGERLIPFVPAYVDAVDVGGGRIDMDWEADY